jgi:hypothetical protein
VPAEEDRNMARGSRTTGRRSTRWALVTGIALISVSVMTFNAFSWFTGAPQDVDTEITAGDLVLSTDDPGHGVYLDVGASEIAPDDKIERVVDLSSSGSVAANALNLTTSDTENPDSILFTEDTNGLQLLIERCSVDWTTTVHPYTGGGSTSVVYASADVNDASGGVALNNVAVDGTVNHLRVLLTLPATADDDFQNETATIRFHFSLGQRAGQYIDS